MSRPTAIEVECALSFLWDELTPEQRRAIRDEVPELAEICDGVHQHIDVAAARLRSRYPDDG